MLLGSRPSAYESVHSWKVGAQFILDSRRFFRSVGLAQKGVGGRMVYPDIVLQYPRGSHIFFTIRIVSPGQTVSTWQEKTDVMRAATGLDISVYAVPARPDLLSLVIQIGDPLTAVRFGAGNNVE